MVQRLLRFFNANTVACFLTSIAIGCGLGILYIMHAIDRTVIDVPIFERTYVSSSFKSDRRARYLVQIDMKSDASYETMQSYALPPMDCRVTTPGTGRVDKKQDEFDRGKGKTFGREIARFDSFPGKTYAVAWKAQKKDAEFNKLAPHLRVRISPSTFKTQINLIAILTYLGVPSLLTAIILFSREASRPKSLYRVADRSTFS